MSGIIVGIGIGIPFPQYTAAVIPPVVTYRILQEDFGLILTEINDPLRKEQNT